MTKCDQVRKHDREKCGRDYKVQENYEGDGRNISPYSSIASSAIYSQLLENNNKPV